MSEDSQIPGDHNQQSSVRWLRRTLQNPITPQWVIAIFTVPLAGFACFAWIEATHQTGALKQQLDILKIGERPFVFSADSLSDHNINGEPQFNATSGRMEWNFAYKNYGKSVAYNLSARIFIKIGTEVMQQDDVFEERAKVHSDVPPGMDMWGTVFSHPGISPDYAKKILDQDGGIKTIVQFDYYDSSLTQRYSNGFCLSHFANGTISGRPPTECQN